jgi:hypothetical protein
MQPVATEIPCFLESGVQKQGAVKPAGQAGQIAQGIAEGPKGLNLF